ncbi:MAG: protein serine/threonine phosphatase [Bacteroidetes bacterium]|nr:protein serine/threonine phosphatase [Bacteroidota bacterium]
MKKPSEILHELQQRIDAIPDKKKQVGEIIDFVIIYGDAFGHSIIPVIDQGISISKEMDYAAGELICKYNLGFFGGVTQGNAMSKHTGIIPDREVMADIFREHIGWYTMGLNLLSYHHWFRGEYEKGFNTIFETIKLSEEKQVENNAWHYFALAIFYFDTKDFENSSISYQRALELFTIDENEYGKARSSNGLASIAIIQSRVQEAIPLLEYAAGVYREIGQYSGLSRALNDMGLLEKANLNYDKAIAFLNESIELRKEIDHVQGLITSYTELGEIYLLLKQYPAALGQFQKGLELAQQAKARQKQVRLFQLLYTTYKELNDTEQALSNFEKFFALKSQLLSDESANSIKRIQTKFEKEKSEKETEIERLKNVELKKANTIIEQKNKDITDSIRYAKRIQLSLLPTEAYIDKQLKRLNKSPKN